MTIIVSQVYDWIKTIFTHLWLSISSINFYQRVMNLYDGYGIKYIFTLSIISSLLWSIFIISYINDIKQYLSEGTISPNVVNLDHIISQLPELNYNGSEISLDDPDPLYINNTYNQPVALIDPKNKVHATNKAKIPIILTNTKLIVSISNSQKVNIYTLPIAYSDIFGRENLVLTQEVVRSSFEKLLIKTSPTLIYFTFPFITLLILFNIFLERGFFIIMIYLITNFFMNMQASIKTCIRLVMFASGVFIFIQPIIMFFAPNYNNIAWIIQVWANFLMIFGILKSSNKIFFIKKK